MRVARLRPRRAGRRMRCRSTWVRPGAPAVGRSGEGDSLAAHPFLVDVAQPGIYRLLHLGVLTAACAHIGDRPYLVGRSRPGGRSGTGRTGGRCADGGDQGDHAQRCDNAGVLPESGYTPLSHPFRNPAVPFRCSSPELAQGCGSGYPRRCAPFRTGDKPLCRTTRWHRRSRRTRGSSTPTMTRWCSGPGRRLSAVPWTTRGGRTRDRCGGGRGGVVCRRACPCKRRPGAAGSTVRRGR